MGIYLARDVLEGIENWINRCPDPKNPRCPCASHGYLLVEANGRENWIEKMNYYKSFRMIGRW
jgi:hypothetical protein